MGGCVAGKQWARHNANSHVRPHNIPDTTSTTKDNQASPTITAHCQGATAAINQKRHQFVFGKRKKKCSKLQSEGGCHHILTFEHETEGAPRTHAHTRTRTHARSLARTARRRIRVREKETNNSRDHFFCLLLLLASF